MFPIHNVNTSYTRAQKNKSFVQNDTRLLRMFHIYVFSPSNMVDMYPLISQFNRRNGVLFIPHESDLEVIMIKF